MLNNIKALFGTVLLLLFTWMPAIHPSVYPDLQNRASYSRSYLTIVHTNDIHAAFCSSIFQCDPTSSPLFQELRGLRRAYPQALFMDAGDILPNVPSLVILEKALLLAQAKMPKSWASQSMLVQQYFPDYMLQLKASQEFINQVGYDVVTLGNHEFDGGPEVFKNFVQGLHVPIVATNVNVATSSELKAKILPYLILATFQGPIGIIGAITELSVPFSNPEPLIALTKATDAIQRTVNFLEKRGIRRIILLSHLGYQGDLRLAQQVSGIDIIVGGHSHTYLSNDDPFAAGPYPTVVLSPRHEPVLIVTTKAYGAFVGVLNVSFAANSPTEWYGHLLPITTNQEIFLPARVNAWLLSLEVVKSPLERHGRIMMVALLFAVLLHRQRISR